MRMENSKSSKDWKLLLRTKAYQVCRAQLWNRQKKQKLLLLLQESIALKASCTVVLGLDTRTRTMEPTIAGLTLNPLCHKWIFTFLCFTLWSLLISSFSLSSFLPFFCFYIANHCFSLCLSSPSFFLFSFMSSCFSFLRCFSSSSFKHFRLVSTCAQPDWWGRGGRSKLKKVVCAYFGCCFSMCGSALSNDFSVPSEDSAIGCTAIGIMS